MKYEELIAMLRSKFPEPQFVFLQEVRDATGFDSGRSADAMAVGMYRSHGRTVWGFEVKMSRADWLRELKQPDKAEAILKFCDHWALVVPDVAMVNLEEVPEGWGVAAPKGKRLHFFKASPKLDCVPPTRIFFTAVVMAARNAILKPAAQELERVRRQGYDEGRKYAEKMQGYNRESEKKLRDAVDLFQTASGVSINTWDVERNGKIGEAVRVVMDGSQELKQYQQRMQYQVEAMERLAEDARHALDKFAVEHEKRSLPRAEQLAMEMTNG